MKDSTAIVIGATGGIGQHVSEYAHQHFETSLLVGRSGSRLRDLQEKLLCGNESGGDIKIAITDIGNLDQMKKLFEAAPTPSLVVLCTGITEIGTLDIENEPLQRMLHTNATGVIVSVQAAVQKLLASQSAGRIVAMGSMSIRRQRPSHGGYAATQGALYGFFRSLRRQLTDSPVRLTLICPGLTRTNLAIEETPDIDPSLMIPVRDIIETIDFLLELPNHIDVPEVFLDCRAQLNYPH